MQTSCKSPKDCSTSALVHNSATVVGAADLHGRADGQTNTITAEEGCRCTTVAAKIEVDIGSVLVGARETALGAQRVPIVVNRPRYGCYSQVRILQLYRDS